LAYIADISVPTFSTQSHKRPEGIAVSFTGNADMAIHAQLKVFLDELHGAASGMHAREVIFDVQELYFMNSSCLSLLLRLINTILASPNKYSLRFRSNPNLRWQKRSLQAIQSYARDIVVIE
jgi:hypothetical protein